MTRVTVSLLFGIAIILLTALTGGSDAIDPWNVQENTVGVAGPLDASHTIGQTFVSRYPRLHAIQVRWIASADLEFQRTARVTLHLRRNVGDSADLASVSIPLGEIGNNAFAKFSFPPIQDSQDQHFYFFLDASHAAITRGAVSVWASGEDDYPAGQLYLNDRAANRDLAFRAYYEPDLPMVLAALSRAAARYLLPGLIFLCVVFVPGWALYALLAQRGALHPVETVAFAGALGLAADSAASLLLLGFGGSIQWLGAGIVAAFGVLLAVAVGRLPAVARGVHRPNAVLWIGAGLALFSVAVGFLQIRDTLVPLWKDSPAHAEFIAAILARGRLPTDSFYHLGFHSIAALLVQISGASIPAAMLLIGQLLLTQIGLSLFLLTKRLTGSAVAALASAVCVWFLSPTPAYWVTWGRYPLLLGAALLPLALLCAIELIERPRFEARIFLLTALTGAGLAFAHVRLMAFYGVFVVIYLAFKPGRARVGWDLLSRVGLVAGVTALLGGMWLGALSIQRADLTRIAPQNLDAYVLDAATAVQVSLTQHGPMLLALAAIGLIAALLRRRRGAVIALAWFGALSALTALPVVGEKYLPLALIVLMSFIPISILVGDLANALYEKIAADSKWAAGVWGAAVLVVSALGARDMISIVNPATIIFTGADAQAMTWIDQHAPADSKFLIDSGAWFGPVYTPTDGGWWIPYLTGRPISYIDSPISSDRPDAAAVARWIDAHGVDLIYLGSRGGILQRTDFLCLPERYTVVYQQDGITIWRVQHSSATMLAPPECVVSH
ncbi:MAG: hypothetical protein KGJ80_00230 [Chloroflexota bacterium]|nr:hypothetical protein [Chloroflexota bacterium]